MPPTHGAFLICMAMFTNLLQIIMERLDHNHWLIPQGRLQVAVWFLEAVPLITPIILQDRQRGNISRVDIGLKLWASVLVSKSNDGRVKGEWGRVKGGI